MMYDAVMSGPNNCANLGLSQLNQENSAKIVSFDSPNPVRLSGAARRSIPLAGRAADTTEGGAGDAAWPVLPPWVSAVQTAPLPNVYSQGGLLKRPAETPTPMGTAMASTTRPTTAADG